MPSNLPSTTIRVLALRIRRLARQASKRSTRSGAHARGADRIVDRSGLAYRELVRQEFTFAPDGAMWEEATWSVEQNHVTHVRLIINPDKGPKDVYATLTSLVLRGYETDSGLSSLGASA